MKTYTTHIKGKDYLYAYDNIYIAKGKSIQKNKSLGRVDSLADISVKKRAFSEYLLHEEKRLRTAYWKENINHADFIKYVSIGKIESVRTELYRAKEDMGSIGTDRKSTRLNSSHTDISRMPSSA